MIFLSSRNEFIWGKAMTVMQRHYVQLYHLVGGSFCHQSPLSLSCLSLTATP